MSQETIAALLKAYEALDALPNFLKQSTEAGSTMFNISKILAEHGVSTEPLQ